MKMLDRMEELGLTQKMLAERMGCSQQYVSKVLRGRENLSLETLCKIENALNLQIIHELEIGLTNIENRIDKNRRIKKKSRYQNSSF